MSKRKTVTPPPTEPKPKYSIGQKMFLITYHRGLPENILEVKITGRSSWECKIFGMPGDKTESAMTFSYEFHCDSGLYTSIPRVEESGLYPNYAEAAKVFAKAFLVLLK